MRTTHPTAVGLAALSLGLLFGAPPARAADGPYRSSRRLRSAARAAGTTSPSIPLPDGCTFRTPRRWSSSTSTRTRSSGRSPPRPGCTASRSPPTGPRLRQQRPGGDGRHRGPEDAADRRHGQDRREPRRHPLRAGAPEVYAFNGRGKSATVFDAKTGESARPSRCRASREFAVLRRKGAGASTTTSRTRASWSRSTWRRTRSWRPGRSRQARRPRAGPRPRAHRLFIGCRNDLMLMLDATNGKVLASVPIGPGVDADAFDPGSGLAFVSAETAPSPSRGRSPRRNWWSCRP